MFRIIHCADGCLPDCTCPFLMLRECVERHRRLCEWCWRGIYHIDEALASGKANMVSSPGRTVAGSVSVMTPEPQQSISSASPAIVAPGLGHMGEEGDCVLCGQAFGSNDRDTQLRK